MNSRGTLTGPLQHDEGNKNMTECPVCGAEISFAAGTVIGELLECADCGSELEVTGLDPATVTEAPETEEDWGE